MNPAIVLAANGLERFAPKLKPYVYVDEMQDMQVGAFFRWVRSENETLTNGAFLVSVELKDEGILLRFKADRRFFSVWADDVFLFRKKSADEILRTKYRSYVGKD
jgi:hypothetical protein